MKLMEVYEKFCLKKKPLVFFFSSSFPFVVVVTKRGGKYNGNKPVGDVGCGEMDKSPCPAFM